MKFLPIWLKWLLPLIALAALSLYAAWLFLPQGSGIGKVLAVLSHPSQPGLSLDQRVVLEVRLPRLITAILVGAVLAVSGLLLQTMTRNPLASPSLLSINVFSGGRFFALGYACRCQCHRAGACCARPAARRFFRLEQLARA